MRGFIVMLMAVAAACGGDALQPSGADAPVAAPPDAPEASGWTTFIQGSWTLAPLTEDYVCVRQHLTEDAYLVAFEPIAPTGTHHTLLTVDDGSHPDGTTLCHTTVSAPRLIFGSGVGTGRLELPDGVALKVSKGEQVLLNLHLFNASDQPISGVSGVRVRAVPAANVVHPADAVLMGPLGFTVDKGLSTVTGQCTLPAGTTIVAAAPHMHQLGVHMKATAGADVLVDEDYSFDRQIFYPIGKTFEQAQLVSLACTYANDTGAPVSWGESTTTEMCFLIAFRYPPGKGGFQFCSN